MTKKNNFGEAYRELEGIVSWFERDVVDVDLGLNKFEQGLALVEVCRKRLKEVENRVTDIKRKFKIEPGSELS